MESVKQRFVRAQPHGGWQACLSLWPWAKPCAGLGMHTVMDKIMWAYCILSKSKWWLSFLKVSESITKLLLKWAKKRTGESYYGVESVSMNVSRREVTACPRSLRLLCRAPWPKAAWRVTVNCCREVRGLLVTWHLRSGAERDNGSCVLILPQLRVQPTKWCHPHLGSVFYLNEWCRWSRTDVSMGNSSLSSWLQWLCAAESWKLKLASTLLHPEGRGQPVYRKAQDYILGGVHTVWGPWVFPRWRRNGRNARPEWLVRIKWLCATCQYTGEGKVRLLSYDHGLMSLEKL